jgi:pyridoxine/pyridoxamine 5'-phosphate oxidase
MPQPKRPYMPGYGVKPSSNGLLDWVEIEPRLIASHNYWLSTIRPDGRPHAAPVWGIWHEGAFYFNTGDRSQKHRNLKHQPYAVMHLESGDEVVIVEGIVDTTTGEGLLTQLNKEYHQKYGLAIVEDARNGYAYRLKPRRALAWIEKSFPDTATQWDF